MFIKRERNCLYLFFSAILLLFVSCIDETFKNEAKEGYIAIAGINTRAYVGDHSGDGLDSKVETLRILAFNKETHVCEDNTFYSGEVLSGNTLRHPINQGEYDFVFLANEPNHTGVNADLQGIDHYDDLKSISYPARYFDSERYIPMIAESNDIEVLANGKLEINGIANTKLTVGLRRLAARIDVVLKSKVDFGDGSSGEFEGVTFNNIPDKVPLVYGLPSDTPSGFGEYDDPNLNYSGAAITRDVVRKLTLADNADCFKIDPALLTTEDKANDLVWAVKVKKVIMPSNFFTTKSDEAKAVEFTVNLIDKYSPSCKLKIISTPVNYTLPANAKLDLTGIIKEPLEVNIQPSPWIDDGDDWDISGVRVLNVSHVKAKMTDMNGVRISFWSNMPVVRVLDTVQKDGEANEVATNNVFNCLAVDANNPDPYRFVYDPATGSGYMDLLVDGTNTRANSSGHDKTIDMNGTYILTLSAAEDSNGKNALQRKIKVEVTQEGLRFIHNPTANQHGLFNAAFFKYNQKGERIITGQHPLNQTWSVTVPNAFRDWLVVSATPSFDPGVGTDSPGDAEDYPVILNQYRGENGYSITGLTGRIYFRIGVKEKVDFVPTEESDPKFGYVDLSYYPGWRSTMRIYVRQGEAGAYIYGPGDAIPGTVHGGWSGGTDITAEVREDMRLLPTNSRRGAAKFSALNLTSASLMGNTNPDYENVGINGARFVDFPSQAGAFFQWAVDLKGTLSGMTDYYRRAFNPSKSYLVSGFPWGYLEFPIMWDGDTNADIPAYKEKFEVCPPGYRRPTDGYTDKISYNGYYDYLPDEGATGTATNYKDQIEYSELRVSLFNVPFAGNAASSADYLTAFTSPFGGTGNTGPGTYPFGTDSKMLARKQLKGTTYTFYSDGFFDRRPIKEALTNTYGVSIGNSKVAYQGVLYFNPTTYASVFFPSAGRLNNTSGALESIGSTGYYWSASAGPPYQNSALQNPPHDRRIRYGAWALESAYNSHNFRLAYQGFAHCIRCVKE